MKQKLTHAEINVGCLLALGYTKKEIALKRKKSESTIRHQAESLYLKTESKNLADITRFMIAESLNINLLKLSNNLSSSFLSISTLRLSQWVAHLFNAFDLVRATLTPKINPCEL
jgi:DNA-binding CsgD family transcriptional regulator